MRWLGGGAANNDNDARNDNRVGGFRGFHGSPRALIAGTARFCRRDARDAHESDGEPAQQAFLHAEIYNPSSHQFECWAFRLYQIHSKLTLYNSTAILSFPLSSFDLSDLNLIRRRIK